MNQPAQTTPRVIAWELTRQCPLHCKHCRGSARDVAYSGELSTDECLRVIDAIHAFCSPVLILTGGEPMARPDVYDIASYAADKGMRVVMAPCGALITPESARKIKDVGIQCLSISLDGACAETHDTFRGVEGAYASARHAIDCIVAEDIPFQINTTVTTANLHELPAILDLAEVLGARTLDLFFLVPTGRGASLKDYEISAEEYERTLEWVAAAAAAAEITVKTTCAPHYARVSIEHAASGAAKGNPEHHGHASTEKPKDHPGHPGRPSRPAGGCIAGRGFVFISHTGILQPCGFLDIPCGDLRAADFNFATLYTNSPVFNQLRSPEAYHGKCGVCEYKYVCGGCRARAFAASGDFLGEEPRCMYIPGNNTKDKP